MVTPEEVTWEVLKAPGPVFQGIRKSVTAEGYQDDKKALQRFLCLYFNSDSGNNCDKKQGKSISPVGFANGERWKVFEGPVAPSGRR